MKAHFLLDNLLDKLSFLNLAVSGRTTLPILSNLLIETKQGKIQVSATDLEIGITILVPASIEEEGQAVIPAKTFSDLVANMTDEKISLETKDGGLEIKGKKSRTKFQTSQPEEFPKLYEEKGEKIATLKKETLNSDVKKVVFAASQDASRPVFSGVLVKQENSGLLMVATDAHRLSLKKEVSVVSTEGAKLTEPIIVSARTLRSLINNKDDKDVDVFVSKKNNQIIFTQGDVTLVGRLIEGEFPSYEKIIPSDFSTKTSFGKNEMQTALKICSVFARDSANIIKLAIKKDKVVVSANSPTVGENMVEIEAKLIGEENEIAFNGRYLLDLLANLDEETMTFEMTGPLNPGVFKTEENKSFLHLIMPIRVRDEELRE